MLLDWGWWCQKGLSVGFVTAAALVHELIEARDEKRLLRLQRQLAGYKLLIIDELGYVNGDSYRLKQSRRRQRQPQAAELSDTQTQA